MKSDEKIDDTVTESNFTYDAYNGSFISVVWYFFVQFVARNIKIEDG